jgi:hypothetical protein
MKRFLAMLCAMMVVTVVVIAQSHNEHPDMQNCPMHEEHMTQQSRHDLEHRGDQGMGFFRREPCTTSC